MFFLAFRSGERLCSWNGEQHAAAPKKSHDQTISILMSDMKQRSSSLALEYLPIIMLKWRDLVSRFLLHVDVQCVPTVH